MDLHKQISKLPFIPSRGFVPNGYHYLGPMNPLEKQLKYDKKTGKIQEIYQKPTNRLDEVSMLHDVAYDICGQKPDVKKCKHTADRKMVDSISKFDNKNKTEKIVKFLINTKQKIGLNSEQHYVDINHVHIPLKALTNYDLIYYAKKLKIPNFSVVDLKFNDYKKDHNYVIFINKGNEMGHYTSFHGETGFYFDSCSLPPTLNVYKHVEKFNNQRIQGYDVRNSLCGHYCLYVLYHLCNGFSPEKIINELENDISR